MEKATPINTGIFDFNATTASLEQLLEDGYYSWRKCSYFELEPRIYNNEAKT